MRNFLVCFALFLLYTPLTAQWQRIETPFQPFVISAVDAASLWSLNLESPKIARTTDGGDTWQQFDLPNSDDFLLTAVLSAIDTATAWTAFHHYQSGNNFVYQTQDGGQHWQVRTPPALTNAQVVSFMKFYTAAKGIVLSYDFDHHLFVHRTNNGGQNWSTQTLQINGSHLGTTTYGDHHIWFYTGSGDLWRSDDGGENWASYPSGLVAESYGLAMEFADSLHGLAFKNKASEQLYRTADGGASWQPIDPEDTGLLPGSFVWGLTPVPGLPNAWLAGYNEGTAYSLDDGATWLPEANYPDSDFRKPEFLNHQQGWGAANSERAVFKWNTSFNDLSNGCMAFTGPLTGKLRRSECDRIWFEGSIPADISEDSDLNLRVELSYPGHPDQTQRYHNLRTGCEECTVQFVPDPGQTTQGTLHFDVEVLHTADTSQTILCTVSPTLCAADTSEPYSFHPGYFARWFHPECFALDSSNCAIQLLTNVCGNDTNHYTIYYRVQNEPAVLGTYYEKNPSYHERVQFYVFAYGDFQTSTCYQVFETLYSCGVSGTPSPVAEAPALSIAPNPANGAFQVFCDNLSEQKSHLIRIRNTTGVPVWSQTLPAGAPSVFVENRDLPAGFYTAELWSDGQLLAVKKLVKVQP